MESVSQGPSHLVPIRRSNQRSAIVFVHGLLGDPRKSWQHFPEFLERDEGLSGWDIYSFGYASSAFSFAAPSYETLALLLYTQLRKTQLADYDRLAIVAHGEGGLIVQMALSDHEDLAKCISHTFFFATPNGGLRLGALESLTPFLHALGLVLFVPSSVFFSNRY